MDDCVFCKIIRGEIPSSIVLEGEEFLAIRDIYPLAAQHALVMPREHLGSLNDVEAWSDGEGQRLLAFTVRVADVLDIRKSGYRVITNVGNDGGQVVDHLHLHVLGGERLGELV